MGFKESNSKGMPELRLEESTAFWCQAQCRELRMRHSGETVLPQPQGGTLCIVEGSSQH